MLGWLALAGLQALQLWRALGNARHLRRHAEPAPARVVSRAAQLVRAFALPVMPKVLASRLTAVPLITGTVRPAILLPAASHALLSRTELDLVLGHELAHVRRGDLVWGWVPAIASRLFFFHPLARLAVREYLAAREEACDAEVLQTLDAAPADYGQLLVKLGVATTDDVLAAAGSSPTFEMLKRRLIMLDRSRTPASRWWWTLAGATAVLLPLTLAAQPVPPVPAGSPGAARGSRGARRPRSTGAARASGCARRASGRRQRHRRRTASTASAASTSGTARTSRDRSPAGTARAAGATRPGEGRSVPPQRHPVGAARTGRPQRDVRVERGPGRGRAAPPFEQRYRAVVQVQGRGVRVLRPCDDPGRSRCVCARECHRR